MIFYNCGEALVDPLSSNLAQDFGHRLFTKKAFIYPWTLSILRSKLFSESVNVNFNDNVYGYISEHIFVPSGFYIWRISLIYSPVLAGEYSGT